MIATAALVESMIDIEIANLRSRLEPYARRTGNPAGIGIEAFGGATAFVSAIPVRLYNSVLGFSDETMGHLDAIRALYAARGISECLEIAPGRLSEPSGLELGRRGYALVEFHGGYARELTAIDRDREPPPGMAIERIDPADAGGLERYLATHIDGWGGDPGDPEALANMRGWRDNESWQFFLAHVDGEPAGAGALDVRGELGLLSAGSTRAGARGRGVQSALIAARVAAAARAGCAIACAGSTFGTASMRNVQRAGFSTIFVRGIWARFVD